jgi:hypothetical protein
MRKVMVGIINRLRIVRSLIPLLAAATAVFIVGTVNVIL